MFYLHIQRRYLNENVKIKQQKMQNNLLGVSNINKINVKKIVVVLCLWEVVYKLYTAIQAVMYNTYLIILSINYNKINSPAVSEKNSVHYIWL